MNDRDRDQLADLRARAYGPGAQGALDAAGWARLQELESALRRPAPGPAAPEPEPAPESPASDTEAEPDLAELLAGTGAEAEPVARPRRRMRWLWPVTVLAAAAVAAGATYAAASVRPVDPLTGVLPETVLQPNPSLSVPVSFWGSTGSTTVYEYHGLWVMRPEGGVRDTPQDCLLVADRDDIDLRTTAISGPVTIGCHAGTFPASVQFAVTEEAPAALLELHPAGTGIRMVVDGDTVGVFVSPVASPDA